MSTEHSHDHHPAPGTSDIGHDHDHDQGHSHGTTVAARVRHAVSEVFGAHSHDVADHVDEALGADTDGRRALLWSLAILAGTALIQAVVVVLSGSVALLGNTLHNVADALTAVPLLIAFRLARRRPTKRYTYGYGRAEDLGSRRCCRRRVRRQRAGRPLPHPGRSADRLRSLGRRRAARTHRRVHQPRRPARRRRCRSRVVLGRPGHRPGHHCRNPRGAALRRAPGRLVVSGLHDDTHTCERAKVSQ